MGQYKVPQNVEAEDKIIGPLTLRQFIYAVLGFGWAIVMFAIFRSIPIIMIILGAPPTIVLLLLAFYSRDGQNFEQLLTAGVGFFANSRRRLWRKEELIETFHVTPHKVVAEQTQRDPIAVRGQLERIATMIDSRGWNQTSQSALITPESDRLVAPIATPAAEQTLHDPKASEDILDLQHSPLAQNLAGLIQEAAADVREEAIEQMKARAARGGRTAAATDPSISVTSASPNDILKLATERDDLTVSQLAATATRITPATETGQAVETSK